MNAPLPDLSAIGRGFEDISFESQAVFRQVLAAMSSPGAVVPLPAVIESPAGLHPAAAAVLLALLDQDTRLWLSPSFAAGGAGGYLRFHTGCVLEDDPVAADFVLARPVEIARLTDFCTGTEAYPERSATVVLQVDALSDAAGWCLSGPGIASQARLRVDGVGSGFLDGWRESQRHFPCGIDLIFACADRIAAMPRTTRAED